MLKTEKQLFTFVHFESWTLNKMDSSVEISTEKNNADVMI